MLLTDVKLVNSLFCWSAWYSSVPLQRSSRTTESTIISQRLAQLIAGLQYTVIVAEVTVVCLRWEPRGLRSTATVGQGKGGASGTHAGTTHRSAAPLTRVRYTHNARTGVVHYTYTLISNSVSSCLHGFRGRDRSTDLWVVIDVVVAGLFNNRQFQQ